MSTGFGLQRQTSSHLQKWATAPVQSGCRQECKGASCSPHCWRHNPWLVCRRNKDGVISRVEKRLELWTHHNISHQEDMQILRYSDMQKYGE